MTASRVLVIGLGGLGCPASLALAQAGVGRLTLADPDVVDLSNLHRQPWHRTPDVGRPKVDSAAERLRRAFPALEVRPLRVRVDADSAEGLFRDHDVVIDATDGAATKFLLSDCAVLTGVPLVHGGVLRFEGQAMRIRPDGPCLRCLFEDAPAPDSLPTCAQAGILGPMTGVIGGLQAMLALAPPDPPGMAELHVFDGRTLRGRTIRVRKAPECRGCSPARPGSLVASRAEVACAR